MSRNFTLDGIAISVQFGRGRPLLKTLTGAAGDFEFRNAADGAYVNVGGLDATAVQHFVTLSQLNAVSAGISWKQIVRLCETANISVSSAPALIDGIAPTVGDRIALQGQSTGSEDGLWIWNGAAVALTRPTDWPTGTDQSGSAFFIAEGTCADEAYVATADPAVVDINDPLLVQFASITVGVTSLASLDNGGGGGTFVAILANGAAPVPTLYSIANGPQIAAVLDTNQVALSIVADSVTDLDTANGAVWTKTATVGFGSGTTVLFTLPANARVRSVSQNVTDPWVGATLPTIDVGTVAAPTELMTGATDSDPEIAGLYEINLRQDYASAQAIQAVVSDTSASAGSADIEVEYITTA